jgi:uncharacterized protein YoxC
MSENRLDRIEKLVESNAKAILSLTNQGVELNNKIDRLNSELNNKLDRLANIVEVIANRYEDQEDRINRLEQQ